MPTSKRIPCSNRRESYYASSVLLPVSASVYNTLILLTLTLLLNVLCSFPVVAPGFTAALLTHTVLGMMQGLERVVSCYAVSPPRKIARSARSCTYGARPRLPRAALNERPSISAGAQLTFSFEKRQRAQCCWQPAARTDAIVEGRKVGNDRGPDPVV